MAADHPLNSDLATIAPITLYEWFDLCTLLTIGELSVCWQMFHFAVFGPYS